jgi:hypothetical protein
MESEDMRAILFWATDAMAYYDNRMFRENMSQADKVKVEEIVRKFRVLIELK